MFLSYKFGKSLRRKVRVSVCHMDTQHGYNSALYFPHEFLISFVSINNFTYTYIIYTYTYKYTYAYTYAYTCMYTTHTHTHIHIQYIYMSTYVYST